LPQEGLHRLVDCHVADPQLEIASRPTNPATVSGRFAFGESMETSEKALVALGPCRAMTGTERRLLEAAQQGDRTAIEQLLRRYDPLVWRVVWSLHPPPGCEREDLAQEARIGLVAAICAWRPERGPCPPFAARCVRNQAWLAVQAAARHKHQLLARAVSLNHEHGGDPTTADDRTSLPLLDAFPATDTRTDPETRLLVSEQLRIVVRAVPSLTERERPALAGTLDGRSYAELGSIIGGSAKAASHAADRARRKIDRALRLAA